MGLSCVPCALLPLVAHLISEPSVYRLKSTPNSLRIAGFPLTFKPRFSSYCYDGVLDLFWRVSRLFIPKRSTAYAEKSGLEVIIRVEYMHHLVASITERMHFLQPPFSRRKPFVCGITPITHWLIIFTRLVFIVMFLLNFFLLVAGSSGAVPFCKFEYSCRQPSSLFSFHLH
jgi:hypothetical protein